jgi:hypothetical protein
MLWARKRPDAARPAQSAGIAAADLPLMPDAALFERHFDALIANAAGAGGVESWLAALGAKRGRCLLALERSRGGGCTMDDVESVLAGVFTARRRLYPALESIGARRCGQLMLALIEGTDPLARRMQTFVDAMPGAATMDREGMRAAANLRRAAWDFAAEIVHFSDPDGCPLMARWVWDEATQSGALRELVRGGDAMRDIPFTNDPGIFEAARQWLAVRVSERGIYRDVPYWIDLVLAQAYVSYLRSVTEGSLGADFGRATAAHEQLAKLLGIDAAPGARPRVKKVLETRN